MNASQERDESHRPGEHVRTASVSASGNALPGASNPSRMRVSDGVADADEPTHATNHARHLIIGM